GAAGVLFLVFLAVHVVTWWEPKVPLDDLYAVYFPFHWLGGTPLLVALFLLSIGVWQLFPSAKRPQTNWHYLAIITFFVTYYFACKSQRTSVLYNAGWWAPGKHGGFPLT